MIQLAHIININLQNSILITPKSFNLIYYSVTNVYVELYKSVTIQVSFYDDQNLTYNKIICLKNNDYLRWGSDDSYLTNYITQNITTIFK